MINENARNDVPSVIVTLSRPRVVKSSSSKANAAMATHCQRLSPREKYSEKKNVTESKDIKNLYVTFSELQLQNRKPDITAVGSSVTSFRFNLSDGTNYELIYVGYGVKDGELFSGTDNFRYFTSADIGWYWKWLNESYEAMPASVEELPTYSNMPQSTLKQPAIEEADNN